MKTWMLSALAEATDVKQLEIFKDKVVNWVTDADMWAGVLFAGIRIIAIYLLTRLIIRFVSKVIDRSIERENPRGLLNNSRRVSTVGGLLKNVTSVICNFVMIMLILSEFHFDLAPLLAGAGVVGLAIGFGAQSLVKDVITGFFIIFEDQFAVGDVIQTGTYKGTVQVIGLRTTKLLSSTGEVHIIPNGSIANVTNYSLANALAVVDVPIKMERSLEASLALIGGALRGIEERNPNVVEFPNVLGIQSMNTSEYVIRVAASCLPNGREAAERQIQSDIKVALETQSALEAAHAEAAALAAEEAAKRQAADEAGAEERKNGDAATDGDVKREAAAAQENNKEEKR